MRSKLLLWVFPLLIAILVSLNLFWSKPLVPGFDTPFYLSEIRSFSYGFPNPLTYPYLDRYLTIAFPGTLSGVFGFDPVTSYRIAVTAIYVALAFVLFRLFKNLTQKDSAAAVLISALVISPFLLTYSSMLFANLTGFLVMFSFLAIETGRDFKYKNILLGFIFGLIFYTHNFSTVSLGLIVATYYFLKLLMTKDVKIIKEGIIVFAIATLIGFVGLSRYFGLDLSSLGRQTAAVISDGSANVVVPTQPVVLGNETQRIIASLKEHSGKFWLYLFPVFALVSLFLSRQEIFKNKKRFLLPLAIFLPSLILTFQPLFHLNFLPERFVSLVVLSTYFFYVAIITLPYFKRFLIPLAVLPLFLNYLASDGLILNKGYRSFSGEEIQIYQMIKPLITKDGIVMLSSNHEYWSRYFLNGIQVVTGDSFISCGTVTAPGYFGEANFILAKLLGENDPQRGTALVLRLKSLYPDKQLYILTDTNLGCGHGKILQNITNVRQLLHQNNWYLYETI
ncbi:TPA: hypothetical protein DEP81_01890 [Candidatus Woesebacteria bacterium]|nr:hypothetical protein [Candidatus Woesebacteria bacterium]